LKATFEVAPTDTANFTRICSESTSRLGHIPSSIEEFKDAQPTPIAFAQRAKTFQFGYLRQIGRFKR
jgi:hypothetical protein